MTRKTDTSPDKISDFLKRGVKEVITKDSILRKLESGRVLRVKHGVDPSGQNLHLGHASVYLKLRDLQKMGHRIVFLMGGFTGRFGDPTEKMESRSLKSRELIEENSKNYVNQISKILDIKDLEIRTNSEWYDKMSAEDFIKLLSHFTVDQVLERDMFQERKKAKLPIQMHEIVYPILQGYDSVMLQSDLTVIGSDQVFNENFGRELQKKFGQDPQDIIAIPLLVGLDGTRKMSKSLNNYIALNESPRDQFGKIMSLPDSVIIDYFIATTRVNLEEIKLMAKEMEAGSINPRDLKIRLARQIVGFYHSPQDAEKEAENFINIFSKGNAPSNISVIKVREKEMKWLDIIIKSGLANSKSEARRLIESGGTDADGEPINSPDRVVNTEKGLTLRIGKHRFVRIELE